MQTAATTRSFEYKGHTITIKINDCVRVGIFGYKILSCTTQHSSNPAQDKFECEIVYPTLIRDLINAGITDPNFHPELSAYDLAEGYLALERYQIKAVCA